MTIIWNKKDLDKWESKKRADLPPYAVVGDRLEFVPVLLPLTPALELKTGVATIGLVIITTMFDEVVEDWNSFPTVIKSRRDTVTRWLSESFESDFVKLHDDWIWLEFNGDDVEIDGRPELDVNAEAAALIWVPNRRTSSDNTRVINFGRANPIAHKASRAVRAKSTRSEISWQDLLLHNKNKNRPNVKHN